MRTQVGEGLIGRDHPAGVLRAHIDRAIDSHGGLVLVTGEAGIGKTALVTGAAEEARRRGALVLGGSCWDSDRAPGYWPWVQVVRGLHRGATEEEWAAARDAAGDGLSVLLGDVRATVDTHDDGGEAADAFHLYDAVTTALVSVSQRRPVVVVLDDLHWADPATLRLLEFAAQHTWFERLLLIGTYRDVEIESVAHPLQPLLLPLVAKATTITLVGLTSAEVGALMVRTAGRLPEAEVVREVHRRTGGNPFFVEQTARLWRADGSVAAIPPGVREAVRRRLSTLPEPVVEVLTTAAVLGQEFHRQLLAACVASPVAHVDRLLDHAVSARLVVSRGGGRFGFAHDLVRETLYAALDEANRRHRHAAVVRAVDRSAALADRLFPADLARHADLAGGEVEPARVVDLLVAAARHASARLAGEEAAGHFKRALELTEDPARRARVALELGGELHHNGSDEEAWRHFQEAAAMARDLDDVELLARVALTVQRHRQTEQALAERLLREAHLRMIGRTDPGAAREQLVQDLIAGTERLARHGKDDEALTFSLWARHDSIWGLGTAHERHALTREMIEVARRSDDTETALFANSLRWVALLELGDPGYLEQLRRFAELCTGVDVARWRLASLVDRSIIAAFRGNFDEAAALLAEIPPHQHGHSDFDFMLQQLRWALWLLQGRFAEIEAQLGAAGSPEHPQVHLLRAITAVEQGDIAPALRHVTEVDAAGTPYPRYVTPLWLRLKAQVAAATRDPRRCQEAREALAPHRGEWLVSYYGCDISGPVDLWLATLDAAQERWDEAVAGFTTARDAARLLGSAPWSLIAGAKLAEALANRGGADDATAGAALRADLEREAAELGMRQVAARVRRWPDGPGPVPTPVAAPGTDAAVHEFRREGAVWRLAYAGRVVHVPDAKGLHDLHLLLGQPGVDIAALELLDPAAGPELVAARRLGGDPILDDEAKASYQRRLQELDDELDRAAVRGDDGRAAALDAERTALLDELRAAVGLAGRNRRLGDEAERARKTVAARIRDALRRLDGLHPELAAHLREAVSTGANCCYAPAEPVSWRL